jgi:hypothetical protein
MALKPIAQIAGLGAALAAGLALSSSVAQAEPAAPAPAAPAPKPDATPKSWEKPAVVQFKTHGRAATAAPTACKIAFVEVKDLRSDPQMGTMGPRAVRAIDPIDWLRAGLGTLAENKYLSLVPAGQTADVELKVELLKAYIQPMNMAKSTTVVLRIRYGGVHGLPEPRIYRGAHTAVNWNSTDDEIQGAMNLALEDAIRSVRADLMGVCWTVPKG